MLNVGLDNVIGGQVLGLSAFRKAFGYNYNGSWVIKSQYQSAWSGASVGAQSLGNYISGWVADRYGHKTSLMISILISLAATSVMIAAKNIGALIAGKTMVGLGVGFVVAQAAPYAKELAPDRFTGFATIGVGTFLHIGQWLGAGVVWITATQFPGVNDERSFRVVFGLQYVFAVLFLVFCWFLPESPYYCVRRGNVERAKKILRYMYGPEHDVDVHALSIEIEIERARESAAETGFILPWLSTNRRRTLIGIFVMTGQLFSGNLFYPSYQTYFYELSGVKNAFAITFANYSIALLGNFLAYSLVDKLGRRNLYNNCMLVCAVTNVIMGSMYKVQEFNQYAAGCVAVTCIAVWKFSYMFGLSPGSYSILGEVPTSKLKAKTNSWINIVNSLVSFGISYAIPPLYNPDAANLGMKMGYLFFGSSMIYFVVGFFCLPETGGRSGMQMDELFQERISARKFGKVKFDPENHIIKETVGRV
ncbi:general substrate transporter [Dipodascopsis uninucleata]